MDSTNSSQAPSGLRSASICTGPSGARSSRVSGIAGLVAQAGELLGERLDAAHREAQRGHAVMRRPGIGAQVPALGARIRHQLDGAFAACPGDAG
jgi:hypothetical protein